MKKNYLIIGGSSGIGKATAEILADNNNVVATYNSNPIENDKIEYYPLNVLDDDFDLGFVPDELNGLVYCPGTINLKPFKKFSKEDLINDYQLQVLGAFKIIQDLYVNLRKGNASIVLFSTVAVQKGFPFHAQVACSKGAIEGLTKSLAAEFAPKIRVNCIAPSLTDTPLAENLLSSEDKRNRMAEQNPTKRLGQAKDIAEMTSFLLSDKASWVTGQILHVDGGMSTL